MSTFAELLADKIRQKAGFRGYCVARNDVHARFSA